MDKKKLATGYMKKMHEEHTRSTNSVPAFFYAFCAIWYMLLYIAELLEEKRCNNRISEQSLNRFVSGAKIDHAKIYESGIQIWLENGSFISAYAYRGKIKVDLLGPDPPDKEIMREVWSEE